jgi:protein-disulfide isomerase
VTEIKRFADFGVMHTPALVVDGVLKVAGRVPPIEEIKKLLS